MHKLSKNNENDKPFLLYFIEFTVNLRTSHILTLIILCLMLSKTNFNKNSFEAGNIYCMHIILPSQFFQIIDRMRRLG